jgi:hypothetical protein
MGLHNEGDEMYFKISDLLSTLASTTIALAAMSCASKPTTDTGMAMQPPEGSKLTSTDAASPAKPAVSANGAPIPPVDARLTLYCFPVTGINHVQQARTLKDQLVAQTGMKDFYIVHGETDSVLYYGYYKDFIGDANPREKARADADRIKIATFRDRVGNQPFHGATFVSIDTPDPEGPPEWNLANTPADRMWSWQIAAYVDSFQRKQYAVDAVREARKQGIEAYYYHGENTSSVCIGAFPAEALKAQDSNVQNRAENSDAPLVVLPTPLPAGVNRDLYINQDGRRVRANVVVPRAEPQDPKLIEAMRTYPLHLINGEEIIRISKDPRTGRETRKPEEAFLVRIKHEKDAGLAGSVGQQPGAGALDQRVLTPQQPTRSNSGAGGLRGIGE